LAIGVPCYVGYNHLVAVVGMIVIDMQKAGLRALRMVSEMESPIRRKRTKVRQKTSSDSGEDNSRDKG